MLESHLPGLFDNCLLVYLGRYPPWCLVQLSVYFSHAGHVHASVHVILMAPYSRRDTIIELPSEAGDRTTTISLLGETL